ncbi:hypothetical protein Cpin_0748 [Chitinophaga pinensis DSM 2588]|uniref:Uncharacterized protein n=1 Tax=Chitinophaga pinensis (strain ATCC 43595 / DSM 2588 / LMG 13176 / NBRC 15968 / NCIMB 11800 / UQM 2034) TaxID=485918 RepID=A0A979G046_CHIPD|nr:hypothetical protein Cpin_0748 [Chitinophaga pinensis DSM 2588]
MGLKSVLFSMKFTTLCFKYPATDCPLVNLIGRSLNYLIRKSWNPSSKDVNKRIDLNLNYKTINRIGC